MDLDYFPKWNKPNRERQKPYDITYMWSLKYNTNEPLYKIETQRHREQSYGYQRGKREGEEYIKSLGLADIR